MTNIQKLKTGIENRDWNLTKEGYEGITGDTIIMDDTEETSTFKLEAELNRIQLLSQRIKDVLEETFKNANNLKHLKSPERASSVDSKTISTDFDDEEKISFNVSEGVRKDVMGGGKKLQIISSPIAEDGKKNKKKKKAM